MKSLSRARVEESSPTAPRAPGTSRTWHSAARSGARILCVRLDDLAHQPVSDDVRVSQIVKSNAVDSWQDALDLHKSRLFPLRQVNLGLVAGDHRLRVNAQSGEEHLHLRGGRVLRLVEDDECVGERTAAHVCERRYFDRS